MTNLDVLTVLARAGLTSEGITALPIERWSRILENLRQRYERENIP
jgi:hypothetical protein